MKLLFLHGWHSVVGGVKPTYLENAGHEVINPALDDDDFAAAVRTAQAEYDQRKPDVIVGSSRGGAVAMNINSGSTPLVLLCPAWKNWGTVKRLKPNSLILHSRQDDVIPFTDSEELVTNSDLPPETLVDVGQNHRLADPEPLKEMLASIEEVVRRSAFIERIPIMKDACQEDARSVLPVYGIQDGTPKHDRTGVLLAIADQGFLITAAHDLKQITDHRIPLYVTSPKLGQGGIPLIGQLHATEEKTVDVAVVELSKETKATLNDAGARFLRVTDIDNQAAPTPGLYLVRGYPIACNHSPMTYSTVLFRGEPPSDSQYSFDSSFHLLLDHSRYLQGRGGEEFLSPKIVGMSGCGIWRLTTRPKSDLSLWKPEERRIVAIQTKCKYGSYMKGTWIKHAFGLIYHCCPQLRRVMSSLHIPQ
jgi:hypothetical protein